MEPVTCPPRVSEWKYIAAPKPELYDLRVDRGETRDLARDRAARSAGRLGADLSRVTARFDKTTVAAAPQPDAASVERLQALGYLGAFAPVTATGTGEDPKDHVADYRQYRTPLQPRAGAAVQGQTPSRRRRSCRDW